jgi:hypothetical protein
MLEYPAGHPMQKNSHSQHPCVGRSTCVREVRRCVPTGYVMLGTPKGRRLNMFESSWESRSSMSTVFCYPHAVSGSLTASSLECARTGQPRPSPTRPQSHSTTRSLRNNTLTDSRCGRYRTTPTFDAHVHHPIHHATPLNIPTFTRQELRR